jgi:hypothetical protein
MAGPQPLGVADAVAIARALDIEPLYFLRVTAQAEAHYVEHLTKQATDGHR